LSNIRLRYSGFIVFLSRFLSLFTGLAFTILITRQLTIEEFGIWQIISAAVAVSLAPSYIVNFWLTRFEARNQGAAVTGAVMNLGMLSIGTTIFFLIILPMVQHLSSPLPIFLIAGIQVPLYYFVNNFEAVSFGVKPQVQGYAFLIFELFKLPSAYILVVVLHYSLVGAILAVASAQVVQMIILGIMLRGRYHSSFNLNYAKRWLKSFWLPLFGGGSFGTGIWFLFVVDSFVISALTSSSEAVGIYRLAFTLTDIVVYTSVLSVALYPKLLAGGTKKDVEQALSYMLMLAIPLAFGLFMLANPFLRIMKPDYVVAIGTLRTLVFPAFALAMSRVVDIIITGYEKVDLIKRPTFKDYLRSGLFIVPRINLINALVYLGSLSIIITIFLRFQIDSPTITLIWAAVLLATKIPFVIYKLVIAKRLTHFKTPISTIVKYLIASTIMCIPLFFAEKYLNTQNVFLPLLLLTLSAVILGAITYFAILYLLDNEFKHMVHTIIRKYNPFLSKDT